MYGCIEEEVCEIFGQIVNAVLPTEAFEFYRTKKWNCSLCINWGACFTCRRRHASKISLKDGLQCRAFAETSIWHRAINNPIWPFDLSPFLVIETGFVFNDFDWHALCSSVCFFCCFI
jgi:hypothetical protein